MNINQAMFGGLKSMDAKQIRAALAVIAKHRTIGDDSNARAERREKAARKKALKLRLKEVIKHEL